MNQYIPGGMAFSPFGTYQLPDGTMGTAQQWQAAQTQQAQPQQEALPQSLSADSPMLNPFLSASAGQTTDGQNNDLGGLALQDYLNRQNQKASDALYGGLMNYQPQSFKVGSANADYAYNATPPSTDPQGLLSGAVGQRSWMTGGNQGLLAGYTPFQAGTVGGTASQGGKDMSVYPNATGGGTSISDPIYNSRASMPEATQQMFKQKETDKQNALDNLMAFAPEYFARLRG